MKTTTVICTVVVVLACTNVSTAQFVTFNNRAAFESALNSTLINDGLDRYLGNDIDFDNSSVNTVAAANPLMGFDVSHAGDEITTQFVNGSLTNMQNTGNATPDIQFLLDLAGVNGAFGVTSNVADTATVAVQTASVNAFGFDTFGFNDQGQSFVVDPGALGIEMGVLTTVTDAMGNMQSFTVAAEDAFFGVVGTMSPIDTITFSAVPTFATSGTEFIAIDNFVGGTSTVPEPPSTSLLSLAGLLLIWRRRKS